MDQKVVLAKNPNMVTRRIDDEIVLLPILKSTDDINAIYSLNAAAARVWELINGKRSLGDILSQVVKEFEVTEAKANSLIEGFLKELHQIKAIVPVKKKIAVTHKKPIRKGRH